jgi:putative methyltransferase (TIGR04325 family)
MAEAGRALLPDATFYETDEQAFARGYDFVMASSSLQYVPDWQKTFAGLAASTQGFLFVTRQPFVDRAASFVVVQRPAMHGYDTEYPGWTLNKGEFLTVAADLGLGLVREFLTGEQPAVPKAPEQPVYRGFLFERLAS